MDLCVIKMNSTLYYFLYYVYSAWSDQIENGVNKFPSIKGLKELDIL